MEHYFEQTVCCTHSVGKRVVYLLLFLGSVLFLLLAAVCAAAALGTSPEGRLSVNWIAVFGIAVFAVLALLCWRNKDKLFIDYDYIFNGGTLNISAVYNSKKRKHLLALELHNIRSCGCASSYAYYKIAAQKKLSCHKWYCNADLPLTYFMFENKGEWEIVLLELNADMTECIKRSNRLVPGAWND